MKIQLIFPEETLRITVLTGKGLEGLLAEEIEEVLKEQGLPLISPLSIGIGNVFLKGYWDTVVALNLALRTASRVLIGVARAPVRKMEDVYQAASQIPWEEFFTYQQSFAVSSAVSESQINQNLMVNLKIKDAVADRFRDKKGQRPNVNRESPQIGIFAKIHQNFMDISFDTSGPSLSHRGYRVKSHMAPLREPVSAGLLRWAGWHQVVQAIFSGDDQVAYFERVKSDDSNKPAKVESRRERLKAEKRLEQSERKEEGEVKKTGATRLPQKIPLAPIFYDFMCGTGTLPIEAALMLMGKYPTLSRPGFPFLNLLPAQKAQIATIYEGMRRFYLKKERKIPEILLQVKRYLKMLGVKDSGSFFIHGSDKNGEVVQMARENAMAAGVEGLCRFKVQNFNQVKPLGERGFVIVNPPYGERIGGNEEEIFRLYGDLGNLWKRQFKGWIIWAISHNEEALKKIGLRSTRKHRPYNGPNKCSFQQYIIV